MTHKLTTFVSGNYSLLSASDEKNILRGVIPLDVVYLARFNLAPNTATQFQFPFTAKIVNIRQAQYVNSTSLLDSLHLEVGNIYNEGEFIQLLNSNATDRIVSIYFQEVILNATI